MEQPLGGSVGSGAQHVSLDGQSFDVAHWLVQPPWPTSAPASRPGAGVLPPPHADAAPRATPTSTPRASTNMRGSVVHPFSPRGGPLASVTSGARHEVHVHRRDDRPRAIGRGRGRAVYGCTLRAPAARGAEGAHGSHGEGSALGHAGPSQQPGCLAARGSLEGHGSCWSARPMHSHRVFAFVGGVALAACLVGGLSGCTTVYPTCWPRGEPSAYALRATPWKAFGKSPRSWDLPDGRQIEVDGHASSSFVVAFARAPESRIRCATRPDGPGLPETRFACWSEPDRATTFVLAPGEPCGSNFTAVTRPACWTGVLTRNGARATFHRGYLKPSAIPFDRVTWVDDRQQLVLAADYILDTQIELYPGPAAAPWPDDTLILVAVAFAYWDKTWGSHSPG